MTEATLLDRAEAAIDEATSIPAPPEELAGKVSTFAKMEIARRDLEDALKMLKNEIGSLGEELLEDFAENGIERTSAHGLTIHPHTSRYVSKKGGVETEEIIRTIRNIGWGDLVKEGYNANSLKSRVVATLVEGEELHPELAEQLSIGEIVSMRSTKSHR